LDELLKGITVVSGNDACVAVAEHLYGSMSNFVDAMNRKAKELGMNQSHFLNPHGLPVEGQVTTPRDMAILASAYLKRFPDSIRYHSMREFTYNNITQHNRNHLLLKDPSVDSPCANECGYRRGNLDNDIRRLSGRGRIVAPWSRRVGMEHGTGSRTSREYVPIVGLMLMLACIGVLAGGIGFVMAYRKK
jgi:hypothetical protein